MSCSVTRTPPPPYSVTRTNIIGWLWLVAMFLAFGAWIGFIASIPLTIGVCAQ